MPTRRVVVPLVALLVVVLVPWWLTYDPEEASEKDRRPVEGVRAVKDARLEPGAPISTRPPESSTGPGAVLEGRVVAGGRGAVADVGLHHLGGLYEPRSHVPPLRALPAAVQSVSTGPDGSFRFENLPEGRYLLQARGAGGRRGGASVEIRSGGGRVSVLVALLGGDLALRGRAVHPDGSPWRGWIQVTRPHASASYWSDGDLTETDAEGRFVVPGLAPGPAVVVAIQPDVSRFAAAPIRLPIDDEEYVLVVGGTTTDLTGTVTRSTDDVPLEGVTVRCISYHQGAELAVQARTGVDGRFRLRRLSSNSRLVAQKPGYALRYEYPEEDVADLDLTLTPLGAITGRVVEAGTRRPVPDARVVALGNAPCSSVSTDAEGRFRLDDVAPGRWLVAVFGGGWYSVDLAEHRGDVRNVDVPPGEGAEIDLEVAAAALARGYVRDAEGSPVSGARVTPHPGGRHYDSRLGEFEAPVFVSDVEGAYLVDTLIPDLEHRLEAEAAGFAPTLSGPFRPTAAAPYEVDLAFGPTRWLLARVVAADGEEPVPGASVRVAYGRASEPGRIFTLAAETDGAGRALVGPLPAGDLEYAVEADDFVAGEGVVSAAAQGVVDQTVRLAAGFAVAGRVLRADGTPAAGLFVSAQQGDAWVYGVQTDHLGAFRLTGLAAGPLTLRVQGGVGEVAAEERVEAGAEGVELRVTSPVSRALVVHILDPTGKPIPRFEGVAAAELTSGWGDGENGRFEQPAGHGNTWIEIRKPRAEDHSPLPFAPVLIGPLTGEEEEITVHLEPGLAIDGRVRGPDGNGVGGIEVGAYPLDRADTGAVYVDGAHADTQTDVEGRFTLLSLGSGRYRIHLSLPSRYAPFDPLVVAAGAGGVEITLAEGADFRPRVLDPSGEPVPGVRIQVTRQNGGGLCWEQTDAKGEVLLVGLAPDGRYGLEVRPPEDRPELRRVDVAAWRPSSDALTLPAAMVVRGRVVDPEGVPVAEATVVGHLVEQTVAAHSPSTRTQKDGTFVLGHLPTGPIDVFAVMYGEVARRSRVHRVSRGADEVVLALGAERVLVLRFENAPASLVGKALVLNHAEMASASCIAHAKADGTATFHVDPEASYDLHVWVKEADVQAWGRGLAGDAGEIELAFAPALTITGRVHAPPGAGRIRVWVDEGGVEERVRADASGLFSLRGLPPGTWTVRARAEVPGGSLAAAGEVEAGSTLDLRLR